MINQTTKGTLWGRCGLCIASADNRDILDPSRRKHESHTYIHSAGTVWGCVVDTDRSPSQQLKPRLTVHQSTIACRWRDGGQNHISTHKHRGHGVASGYFHEIRRQVLGLNKISKRLLVYLYLREVASDGDHRSRLGAGSHGSRPSKTRLASDFFRSWDGLTSPALSIARDEPRGKRGQSPSTHWQQLPVSSGRSGSDRCQVPAPPFRT